MGNVPPSAFRQPPSPLDYRRSQNSTIAGNTETAGDNCVSVNDRTRTRAFYVRRSKNKSLKNIESLPDELVIKILLHLPAQDVYDPVRLVCRKWYRMIHTRYFIYEHHQHSPSGLLFQCFQHKDPLFFAVRKGRVEISTLNYKFPCRIWVSCNGLILEYGDANTRSLYITNPATKQHFVLPPYPTLIRCHILVSIAYAAASMEYKVVIMDCLDNGWGPVRRCFILTVGVDESWRNVCIEHLPVTVKKVFLSTPLITEGFIHWAKAGPEVLTMNVETEIITETPVPVPHAYVEKTRTHFLSTGRYLSFVIELETLKWEVWEMEPETGEWRQMPNIIDLEAHKCRFEDKWCNDGILQPFGWLNYPEVLLFGVKAVTPEICFVYKFQTGEIELIQLPKYSLCYGTPVHHKNSLVWLGGC